MSAVPDEPKPPLAVLNYASVASDGVPEWVPEAEVLIEARKSPNQIRKFFRKTEDAVKYYAKSMARRYNGSLTSAPCTECGGAGADLLVQVVWVATSKFKSTEIRFSQSIATASFLTLHPICRRCAHRWFKSFKRSFQLRRWVAWGHFGLFALLVFSFAARIPFVYRVVGSFFPIPDFWAVFPIALIVVWPAAWLVGLYWRLTQPKALKELMPKDVRLYSLNGFSVRQGAQLRFLGQ